MSASPHSLSLFQASVCLSESSPAVTVRMSAFWFSKKNRCTVLDRNYEHRVCSIFHSWVVRVHFSPPKKGKKKKSGRKGNKKSLSHVQGLNYSPAVIICSMKGRYNLLICCSVELGWQMSTIKCFLSMCVEELQEERVNIWSF